MHPVQVCKRKKQLLDGCEKKSREVRKNLVVWTWKNAQAAASLLSGNCGWTGKNSNRVEDGRITSFGDFLVLDKGSSSQL